ncbi:response regulator transcription factor [Spirosoma flavum]|uniref:Response regulator transcription factor n=1 Tax=Spirosoma flavum TaxID=2048557 RepID=A0ABW6AP64_9BACT
MRILIVEDELKLAISLKRGLKEFGFQVAVAFGGAAARRAIDFSEVNLVILDVNLPDVSGSALCREIRTRNVNLPIIMLTALGTIENKLADFDAGADDYVMKPFELTELLA